ncbi:unnamed protein product [Durusdinium trenchii]|uniref:J domain-containing protein n=1 Tax=Durusdinium trenchii TaxID=1381693 RepID=A0ABP0LAP3_9DINO
MDTAAKARANMRFSNYANSIGFGEETLESLFPEGRRRIVGKQPATIMKMLRGPFSDYSGPARERVKTGRATLVPRGHYDVLQLSRSSGAAQVRGAFRLQALMTHPDRGGRTEDFHAVAAAFDVLSDSGKRAAYDQELEDTGNSDGLTEDGHDFAMDVEEDESAMDLEVKIETWRAMRTVLHKLLNSNLKKLSENLANQSTQVLQALFAWLLVACSPRAPGAGATDGGNGDESSRSGVAGIYKQKGGAYSAYIAWEKLKLRTYKTYSLPEVLDWHITLVQLKATALARLCQPDEETEEFQDVLLTEDELARAYQASPTMRLSFSSVLSYGTKRVVLPSTLNLGLATKMQFQARDILRRFRGDDLYKKTAALDKLKEEFNRRVVRQRNEQQKVEKTLLNAVHRELHKRSGKQGTVTQAPQMESARAELLKARVQWRQQAEMAMELRDALGLTHQETVQAVDTLKTSPEVLQIAKECISREVKKIHEAEVPAQAKRGREESKVSASEAKKPRNARTAQATVPCKGTSRWLPKGQEDLVLKCVLPFLDLKQRCLLAATSSRIHGEVVKQHKDFKYEKSLFMWSSGAIRKNETELQLLTRRLSKFLAAHPRNIVDLDLGSASLTMLEDKALQRAITGMQNLKDVVIPKTATSMRNSSFGQCLPRGTSTWSREEKASKTKTKQVMISTLQCQATFGKRSV